MRNLSVSSRSDHNVQRRLLSRTICLVLLTLGNTRLGSSFSQSPIVHHQQGMIQIIITKNPWRKLSCDSFCTNTQPKNSVRWIVAALNTNDGNDNDDNDDDYDDKDDDDIPPQRQPPRTRQPPRPRQVERTRIRTEYKEPTIPKRRPRPTTPGQTKAPIPYNRVTLDRYRDQEDDYDDDEDDEDDGYDEDGEAGNYWYNPPARYDAVPSPKRKERIPRPDEPPRIRSRPKPINEMRGTNKRRKTTFRSGTPPARPVIEDFYKQLFWYGFDPDDISSPADKTMFGGTKGKFNGLAFLRDRSLDPTGDDQRYYKNNGKQKQRPKARRQQSDLDDEDDGYEYDDDDDDDDDDDTFKNTLDRLLNTPPQDDDGDSSGRRGRPSKTRPFLEENLKPEFRDNPSPPTRRKRRARQNPWHQNTNEDFYTAGYKKRDFDEDRGRSASRDWAAQKVSNWFRKERDKGDDFREFDEPDYPKPRKSKNGSSFPWRSPLEVMESLLGGDEQKRGDDGIYNDRQTSINRNNGNDRKNGMHRERRKGYTYRYDVDMSEFDSVVEVDIVTDDDQPTDKPNEDNKRTAYDSRKPNQPPRSNGKEQKQALSKDERTLAWERVPPPNVPAWGPTGDLGMDALTRAYLDATDEIREARYRLDQRTKEEQQAKDAVTILKVDMRVQKRRLEANMRQARSIQDKIRSMEIEIEEAARAVRKANARVQFAQERLSELEELHGYVLLQFNPTRAEEEVVVALQELTENEPAARLRKPANDARDSSQTETKG